LLIFERRWKRLSSSQISELEVNTGEPTVVFTKRNAGREDQDLSISGLTGRRKKNGHVGIEVEVETARAGLPREKLGPYWYFERDGSLRGADSGEYILVKPINFTDVPKAVNGLWDRLRETNVELTDSNRTSVHVHLNVLPFFQNRLTSLIALWYTFEEILTAWCGDDRQGNLFCLRAKDGPAIVTSIKHYIESKGTAPLSTQTHHYAAFNASSIWEIGSVEIRTLRGVTTPEPIIEWVRILQKLYDASERYPDPRTLLETFSIDGPMDFFRKTFAEEAETILNGVELDTDAMRSSMYEGMRYAQDVIYARDWTNFKPKETAEDPFNRNTKNPRDPDITWARVNEEEENLDMPPDWADPRPGGGRIRFPDIFAGDNTGPAQHPRDAAQAVEEAREAININTAGAGQAVPLELARNIARANRIVPPRPPRPRRARLIDIENN
jgi:hypothetical protein